MGGGNSKGTKAEVIKPTAQGQNQLKQNASNSPTKTASSKAPGPSSKPNFQSEIVQEDVANSPIKMQGRISSKPLNPHQLAHNPSEDSMQGIDHSTPGTLAKKTKQQAQGGAVRQPQMPLATASPAMSSTKSPMRSDPLAAQRDADAQRQRQIEEDKLRQLQAIKEQQKAKKAAAAAAAASSQKREPTVGSLRNDTNGTEIFAQHNSPQKQGGQGLGYSYNKFTGGMDESEASGDFRQVDMHVQGNGMMRNESGQSMPGAAVAAPMANINFKVVDYGQKRQFQNDAPSYAQNGTMAVASSGIHMGMMGENDNKDDQQNRNIDMAELNELLGM